MLDRETTPHYWLTVVAQDHGIVTLSASIEVSLVPLPFHFDFTHPRRDLFTNPKNSRRKKKKKKNLWGLSGRTIGFPTLVRSSN